MGQHFQTLLHDQPLWVLVGMTCAMMTFLTEFTSNTATCNIVLPILAAASSQLGVPPQILMVPAAVSASCGFMLPVATPPNAIIFASGQVSVASMARYGLLLNLLGIVVVTVATLYLFAPLASLQFR